jgi:hypothetical protein
MQACLDVVGLAYQYVPDTQSYTFIVQPGPGASATLVSQLLALYHAEAASGFYILNMMFSDPSFSSAISNTPEGCIELPISLLLSLAKTIYSCLTLAYASGELDGVNPLSPNYGGLPLVDVTSLLPTDLQPGDQLLDGSSPASVEQLQLPSVDTDPSHPSSAEQPESLLTNNEQEPRLPLEPRPSGLSLTTVVVGAVVIGVVVLGVVYGLPWLSSCCSVLGAEP